MATSTIRHYVDEDIDEWLRLRNQGHLPPMTRERYLASSAYYETALRIRVVADQGGALAGIGLISQQPHSPPGELHVDVRVDHPCRNAGIGTALFQSLLADLQRRGTVLSCDVDGDDRVALAWAEKMGFSVELNSAEGEIDRDGLDRIVTLPVTEPPPEIEMIVITKASSDDHFQKLHDVCVGAVGATGEIPPAELFRALFEASDGRAFAVQEKGQFLGTAVVTFQGSRAAHFYFLGVLPEARGRNLGAILASHAFHWMASAADRVLFSTASTNDPVLQIATHFPITITQRVHLTRKVA